MDYNITTEPAASSSSPSTHQWKYDVFVSFRGADTRFSFIDLLYSSLQNRGIDIFMDDDELQSGLVISSNILQAIEKTRISLIIFSRNYASSTWCLEELAKILECKNSQKQIVIPIYYDVDPSDVRSQTGTFGEAFVEHESRFKDDLEKVKRWRTALTEAANLAGMVRDKYGYESNFINAIIEEISRQLNRAYVTYETNYLVGIHSRMREMNDLLGVGVADVRMVGIWGIGGVGKTTLAKAVYNSIAHKFEGSCFLGNVKENSMAPGGLVQLQKTLLHNILGLKISTVTNVDSGVNIIKSRLRHKRVLLIVDDVDQLDPLKYLAGSSDWFGAGSRIIISTRDEHLLLAHKVDFTYQVKKLEPDEALELFVSIAFPTSRIPNDYLELGRRVVGYAQGLPLALRVMGSYLYGRSVDEWHSTLESSERGFASDMHEILKITKRELEHTVKVPVVNALVNIEEKHTPVHDLQGTGFSEWIFLIISLMLEIISAICDQLSSSEKPEFAVIGVFLAVVSLVICVSELIYKGRKGKVEFRRCRMRLWWFFCPITDRLFGTLPDLFGLICGISQCASSIAQCVCVIRHKDNPFKVNLLPIIFLICLVVSKLFENCKRYTKSSKSMLPL